MITDSLYMGQHINFINDWLHSSVCNEWSSYNFFQTQAQCSAFLYGVPTKGVYSMLLNYYVDFKEFQSKTATMSLSQLINSQTWVQEMEMVRYILVQKITEYTSYFQNLVNSLIDTTGGIKIAVLLSCIFGAIGLFLLIWMPYLYQLRTEILRTDSMLMLIPNDVIAKSKHLRDIFDKKYSLIQ